MELSTNDRAILAAILNRQHGEILNPFTLPPPPRETPPLETSPTVEAPPSGPASTLSSEEVAWIKEQERKVVKLSSCSMEGQEEALSLITRVIDKYPQQASPYNNRAQVYRLKGAKEEALQDLNQAIALSRDQDLLALAYTQKGLVLREKGEEEAAFEALERGAKYGNAVAKQIMAKENPLAKLCHATVLQLINPPSPSSKQ